MAQQQTDLSYVLGDLSSRVRILESKYNLLGERLLVVNKNMIEEYKKILAQIKVMDLELKELKNDIFILKENMKKVVDEMKQFAKKENIKVLEKYINLWNPLTFVKESEVIDLINKELGKYVTKENLSKIMKGEKLG